MRGQVSMEFMIFFGMLLIITTFASVITITTTNRINNENTVRDAKTITRLAATEINIAYEIGDGYSRTFYVKPILRDGSDYNLTILNQTIYLSWVGGTYLVPLLTHNITHNNLSDNFTLNKGNNTIRNVARVLNIV